MREPRICVSFPGANGKAAKMFLCVAGASPAGLTAGEGPGCSCYGAVRRQQTWRGVLSPHSHSRILSSRTRGMAAPHTSGWAGAQESKGWRSPGLDLCRASLHPVHTRAVLGIPNTSTGWAESGWRAALRRRLGGAGG